MKLSVVKYAYLCTYEAAHLHSHRFEVLLRIRRVCGETIEGQLQNIDDYNMSLVLKTGVTVFLKSIFDIQY
jgi:hypothetical protein